MWTFHMVINTIISCVENSIRAERILFITMLTNFGVHQGLEQLKIIIKKRFGGGGFLKFKRWWIANTIAMKLKDLNLKRLVKIEQYVPTCISVYFGIHAQSARVRVTCKRCREEKNFVGSSCPLIFWLFRHLENFLLEKNH